MMVDPHRQCTLPRLRGEVGLHRQMQSGGGGTGLTACTTRASAPHPNPLPARTGRGSAPLPSHLLESIAMSEATAVTGLAPIEDLGGEAQPLLQVNGLTKHFPVRGGLFGARKT